MTISGFGASISSLFPTWNQAQNTISGQLQHAIDSNSTSEIETFASDSKLMGEPLPNGEMPLNYAIRLKRHEIVEKIATKHLTLLDITDSHGLTPIDHALLTKDNKITGILLGCKLNIECKNFEEFFLILKTA